MYMHLEILLCQFFNVVEVFNVIQVFNVVEVFNDIQDPLKPIRCILKPTM